MKILGMQKLTLLDFPGKTACTLFTGGCNLRCPFCHNGDLVLHPGLVKEIPEEDIFELLDKRKHTLEGVCITGGEPMLMKDLPAFCEKIKERGFAVKIDTNGFFPEQLKYMVKNGLCDYVAMDVKNSMEKYPLTIGIRNPDLRKPLTSIEFLKGSTLPHEFRTTVCKPFHTLEDLVAIARLLGEKERYFLQGFRDSGGLLGSGISAFSSEEMKAFLVEVLKIVPLAELRGINT